MLKLNIKLIDNNQLEFKFGFDFSDYQLPKFKLDYRVHRVGPLEGVPGSAWPSCPCRALPAQCAGVRQCRAWACHTFLDARTIPARSLLTVDSAPVYLRPRLKVLPAAAGLILGLPFVLGGSWIGLP